MKQAKLWGRSSAAEAPRQAEATPTMPQKVARKPVSGKAASGKRARKSDPAHARREFLALRPMRNPALEWSEEDGHVVLDIKLMPTWQTRVLNLFFQVPRGRRVALDAIGTDVWQMSDGQHTIGQIAKSLANKYKLNAREAELSLQQFFKDLGRRGYIGFMVEAESAPPQDAAQD